MGREGERGLPVVCDLDGVVWLAGDILPGAQEALVAVRGSGAALAFFTNNSSDGPAQVASRLRSVGVRCTPGEVLTSAAAAGRLLSEHLEPGARVLVCAGRGVRAEVTRQGLTPVEAPPADAVVVGWTSEFDFEALDRASSAVRSGALFVATNADATYPVPGGLVPGNGALVAAVAVASGREPLVAGKPHEPAVALVRDRFPGRGVVIGDRPSTDGALAAALGWSFALVRSSVTAAPGESSWRGQVDYVGDCLADVVDEILPEGLGGRADRGADGRLWDRGRW